MSTVGVHRFVLHESDLIISKPLIGESIMGFQLLIPAFSGIFNKETRISTPKENKINNEILTCAFSFLGCC